MIPSIEEIVAGLLAGAYTKDQAVEWLNQHVALALGQDESRDYFAGQALQGWLARFGEIERNYLSPKQIATEVYAIADAMIAARRTTESEQS